MKNYKDMAESVFRRRDEYVAEVRRKKKIALSASLSLCAVCLAVLGAFGIWKTGILEPDPAVIGTKPHSFTETTDVTMQSLSGNAASEGKTTENTEVVSGNSVTTPQDTKNPQATVVATDPAEKPLNPTVKPTLPTIKPTLPLIPTLPIGPTLPSFPSAAPDVVPPTSGDYPKPKPPAVLPTDPIEPDVTGAIGENEPATDITWVPSVSPEPTTAGSDYGGSDEAPDSTQAPVASEPGGPGRPDEAPDLEEPTEPTESPVHPTEGVAPDVPPTSVEVNRVEGKVLDQYGHPIKGAVVKVYYDGEVVGTRTTDSNGYFYISKFRAPATIKVYSVPDGYTLSGLSASISKGNSNIVLICNKK